MNQLTQHKCLKVSSNVDVILFFWGGRVWFVWGVCFGLICFNYFWLVSFRNRIGLDVLLCFGLGIGSVGFLR